MPVINQLWPAGSADTRMHDRPARPTAFCWNQKYSRVCGEKAELIEHICDYWGSPPRMRGKEALVLHGDALLGITPAYAGKSPSLLRSLYGLRDHPRICGEKNLDLQSVVVAQ